VFHDGKRTLTLAPEAKLAIVVSTTVPFVPILNFTGIFVWVSDPKFFTITSGTMVPKKGEFGVRIAVIPTSFRKG